MDCLARTVRAVREYVTDMRAAGNIGKALIDMSALMLGNGYEEFLADIITTDFLFTNWNQFGETHVHGSDT